MDLREVGYDDRDWINLAQDRDRWYLAKQSWPVANLNAATDDFRALAEIISVREVRGLKSYYVHYVDFNKRLDEWVTEERLDTRKVQFPRRDGPAQAAGTGTPKKLGGGNNSVSRPASPPAGPEMQLNGSAVLAAALQKKISRKRKGISLESEVGLL
ncbi:hypothetical protein ANN_24666 [Periplaneta americana]|uniref:Chromo domain-containing protein n=1 Tax=Periplaneta americana TaxID=6978 RepID=A0ABQ8S3N4_PERAM|nr:hypothetical protein ANN_24666 [Periplaneta americana]